MENVKPRNLIPLKGACAKGHFGQTTAYKLINAGKIDAFKMQGRVMIDANSIERYHLSLPKIEPKANRPHEADLGDHA
jgi:Helix-turn-helix domain